MFKRNAMGNTRTKIIAGAVMLAIGLSAAGAAMSTDVFGGGATLPAGAYVGFNFNAPATPAKLSTNATTNHLDPAAPAPVGVDIHSLFGAWANSSTNHVSFCQTGSGNGKKIFDNTDGASPAHALTATDFCDGNAFVAPSTTSGFGASLTTAVNPHFAASDAPMSQQEYGWFFTPGNKTSKYTQPVQFPAVVGSVAIVLNNPNITTQVNLTDAQLCQVYSGQITTWTGLGLPAAPTIGGVDGNILNVVFRSDGSGTSFSLSNHLTAVCGGVATSPHLVADQAFTTVVGQFFTSGLPSRFIGANGNAGVIAKAAATNGSIAYAESANFKNVAAANPSLSATKVNGFDPFADLPNAITLATVNDRGITGVDTTGHPATGVLTPITQAGCMNLVEPATYATSTTRYPIVAVSYLIANNTGNGSDLAAVQGLVGTAYGAHTGVTTIGTGTGYAFATVLPTVSAKVNTCIKS